MQFKTPNISKSWKKPETALNVSVSFALKRAKDTREGYCALNLPICPERLSFRRQTLHECDFRLAECARICIKVCVQFFEVLYLLLSRNCGWLVVELVFYVAVFGHRVVDRYNQRHQSYTFLLDTTAFLYTAAFPLKRVRAFWDASLVAQSLYNTTNAT